MIVEKKLFISGKIFVIPHHSRQNIERSLSNIERSRNEHNNCHSERSEESF